MSEETGPRYTWHMRPDEKRMDVTIVHSDEFAVVNAMLSISRTNIGVIWALDKHELLDQGKHACRPRVTPPPASRPLADQIPALLLNVSQRRLQRRR